MHHSHTSRNRYRSIEPYLDEIINRLNKNICVEIGCGIGKPVNFINALYRRAKRDPSIDLTLLSALSLEKPASRNPLEKRLLEPIITRLFNNTLDFEHVVDLRANRLPDNVKLYEWMLPPGRFLMHDSAQRLHVAGNFSDAPRDITNRNINILCHQAASAHINGEELISGSTNSDIIPPIMRWMHQQKQYAEKLIIAEINKNIPFMWGDMIYKPSEYDYIFEGDAFDQMPFCPLNEAIDDSAHIIGFYASLLVKDGGTLQIGIGSLEDAINNALIMRHCHPEHYSTLCESSRAAIRYAPLIDRCGGTQPFEDGLFCNSEMFVGSFLNLYDQGIIKRNVYDDYSIQSLLNQKRITAKVVPDTLKALWEYGAIDSPLDEKDIAYLIEYGILANDVIVDDGFLIRGKQRVSADLNAALRDKSIENFLGDLLTGGRLVHATLMIPPRQMYQRLNNMPSEEKKQFALRDTLFVNTLYGDERLKRAQRLHGRFINFTLVATLFGAAASETVEHQQVVSGIGGQLDLVHMANAMDDARSILLLRATRGQGKKLRSNIVFEYGACSIPRQMRDIIVTEYGIADLQGLNDEECAIEMLKIADSRFQANLLAQAKKYKKIAADYMLPDEIKDNLPGKLTRLLATFQQDKFFGPFPFGTDLSDEEYQLTRALNQFAVDVRNLNIGTVFHTVGEFLSIKPYKFGKQLARMGLCHPKTLAEKLQRAIVVTALDRLAANDKE